MGNITIPSDMGMGTTEVDIMKWLVKRVTILNQEIQLLKLNQKKLVILLNHKFPG